MANQLLYANNASSTLLGNVGPTDTSFALAGGAGAKFPNPGVGQSFMLTVESATGLIEIVEVTERNTDILTVIRGREGTAASSFLTGAVVECRLTSGLLNAIDFRKHSGEANGTVVLDGDGQVPITMYETTLTTFGDARWNVKLEYTPVQMGTGVGQLENVVKLGWSAGDKLLVTIDDNDEGILATEAWATTTFAAKAHSHAIADVTGLQTALNGKAAVAQTHAITDVTGLQNALNSKLDSTGGTISGSLTVTGAFSAASVIDTSDVTTKTDIVDLSLADATAMVLGTRAVRYFSKLEERDSFGVVANDQANITPELVKVGSDGLLGMNYGRLVAPLCKVVADLLHRVGELEASRGDGS
jgi:hypothetical protein